MQFERETVRHNLATIPCRHCGSQGGTATLETEPSPHMARVMCNSCGAWLDWLSWPPERPAERKRRRQRITTLGEDRCELCLRSRFEIPPPGKLEEHHVIEHAQGGDDHPDNTRVYCTGCHSFVNWVRTYFGHYHPAPVEEEIAWE